MKWAVWLVCAVLFGLLIFGCGQEVTVPGTGEQELAIQQVGESDPLVQQFLGSACHDSLSPLLGWQDWPRAVRVDMGGGTEALLVPLEAEDELRFMAVLFRDGKFGFATAFGLAATSWFSVVRAESLSVFEGWVFVYDLKQGQRRITSYFESGQLVAHDASYPVGAWEFDPLASDDRFSCLAQELTAAPRHLRPSVFLESEDPPIMAQAAAELTEILPCLQLAAH